MIHLSQAVVVEGKYDKIHLQALLDALILPTDGFRIFHDPEMAALLKRLAQTTGIIVMTDSDTAGLIIRNHIKSITGGAEVIQVYLPPIPGKERRKKRGSKEGVLGVEGTELRVIEQALIQAGVVPTQSGPPLEQITKLDLYQDRLSGAPDAAKRRKRLLQKLNLPSYLSTNSLLELINRSVGASTYHELVAQLEHED